MFLPLAGQLETGPGRPLMVWASEIFGANPVCVAWFITASVSAFHHSPAILYRFAYYKKVSKFQTCRAHRDTSWSVFLGSKLTQYDGNFSEGLRERVRNMSFGKNDNGAIKGCSKPWDMCMPPQCSSLANDRKIVHITLPCLNWTLCDVGRSICPATSQLANSMPEKSIKCWENANNHNKLVRGV